jgi:hypothetical protein
MELWHAHGSEPFKFHRRRENFLVGWTTVSFPRRSELRGVTSIIYSGCSCDNLNKCYYRCTPITIYAVVISWKTPRNVMGDGGSTHI